MNYQQQQLERVSDYFKSIPNSPIKNSFDYVVNQFSNMSKEIEQKRKFDIDILCESLADEIESNFIEIISDNYSTDRITELCDSWVPVYNYDLAQYLANNFNLAYPDDIGVIEGETDIFKIISWSIYESLNNAAYEKMQELISENTDFYEDLQNDYANINEIIPTEHNSEVNQLIINALCIDIDLPITVINDYFDFCQNRQYEIADLIDNMGKF